MLNALKFPLVFCLIAFAWSCKKDIVPDQSQSEAFVKLIGGSSIDVPQDMIIDGENTLISGTLKNSGSGAQAALICADKNGNQQSWSPLYVGGQQSIAANKIFKTGQGDYIVVGTQQKSANNKDIFVSRVSVTGVVAWTQYYGGTQNEEGNFGLELSTGGFVVGGYTESYGNGYKDIYLIRIDNDGNFIWQSTIGFGFNEAGNDIIELNGWLYVLGYTESFGLSANMFVVQAFLSTGRGYNFNYFPKAEVYSGSKICILPGDKMVLLGIGNSSSYVNCISRDLSSVWEVVSPAQEVYNSLAIKDNALYFVGSKNVQENPDILIARYNYNGGSLGSEVIPSSGNQHAKSVSFFPDGKICITGVNLMGSTSQIFLMKKGM